MPAPKLLPISPARYYKRLRHEILTRTRALSRHPARTAGPAPANRYADLYEEHAVANPPESSIGGGDFEVMGQAELAILVSAGLRPSSSLLDFGCGTGRLAVHAAAYLSSGAYIGTDISPTMLKHATDLLTERLGAVPANVRFVVQPGETFPTDEPVDFICAYSVFTHMEHEDTFRYLRAALDISTPETIFVASVLQIDNADARHIFLVSSSKSVEQRWAEVRNVVTSPDLFTEVARLAGWTVTAWYPGSAPAGTLPDGQPVGVGQSVVVMRPGVGLAAVRSDAG